MDLKPKNDSILYSNDSTNHHDDSEPINEYLQVEVEGTPPAFMNTDCNSYEEEEESNSSDGSDIILFRPTTPLSEIEKENMENIMKQKEEQNRQQQEMQRKKAEEIDEQMKAQHNRQRAQTSSCCLLL